MSSATETQTSSQSVRFTLDGSEALETRLARTCGRVSAGVQTIVPPRRLEALVLGGGYGRGQGGVLKTQAGDQPYNDLEFYVFLRGNRLWNDHRYRDDLHELGNRLSAQAGLQVEFKIDSLARLRRSPISMFTYDLLAGHRTLFGGPEIFRGCEHHFEVRGIPLSEATRLLLNRCTGLLLARELLQNPALTAEQADFVGRNLAKAQLALGDAVLTAFGQYHWNCLERHCRLQQLTASEPLPWLEPVRAHHAAGVEFKLHPCRTLKPAEEFRREHRRLSALAMQVWLWLESRRLRCEFSTPRDYAFSGMEKCSGTVTWRNSLLNLRTFGPKIAFDRMACRYPRERLLNTLPLLLWNGESSQDREVACHLRHQLQTDESDWTGWVAAYKRVWADYG